jgi:hypothetical protein
MNNAQINAETVSRLYFRPLQASQVKYPGWYLHLDLEYQKGPPRWGHKAYGAWFYELTPEGWRNENGCLDCGPFEPDELFLGPIDMTQLAGKNA